MREFGYIDLYVLHEWSHGYRHSQSALPSCQVRYAIKVTNVVIDKGWQ